MNEGSAEDLSNMRQVYLMLSSFTHDNDGAFPNEESAVFYLEKQPAPTSSNDYFRQLFVGTGFDDVEELFWIKRASVCNNVPPDKMTSWHGKHGLSRILGRGECGIAYTLNQTMQSNPERILMLSAYKAGTTDFDPGLYGAKESGGQILVTRIDGSAKALNLRNGRPLDETGADLLKDAT